MRQMFDESQIKKLALQQVKGNYIPIKDFSGGSFQIP